MNQNRAHSQVTPTSAVKSLSLADAALGAAGHEMSDPAIREIGARTARGEITADQAAEEIKRLAWDGNFKE